MSVRHERPLEDERCPCVPIEKALGKVERRTTPSRGPLTIVIILPKFVRVYHANSDNDLAEAPAVEMVDRRDQILQRSAMASLLVTTSAVTRCCRICSAALPTVSVALIANTSALLG